MVAESSPNQSSAGRPSSLERPNASDGSVEFASTFGDLTLEEGWYWLREDACHWALSESGLELTPGRARALGADNCALRPPTLLLRRVLRAISCEVSVGLPPAVDGVSVEASLFWYLDDRNFIRCSVERDGRGVSTCLFAKHREGVDVAIIGCASLEAVDVQSPIRLRLELSEDGSQMTGRFRSSVRTHVLGACLAGACWDVRQGHASPAVGFSARISAMENATDTNAPQLFRVHAFKAELDKCKEADGPERQTIPGPCPMQSMRIQPPPMPASHGGWTLSSSLTDAQRLQVSDMLSLAGLDSLNAEQPEQATVSAPSGGSWTISQDLTPAQRMQVDALIGSAGLAADEAAQSGYGSTDARVALAHARSRSRSP